MEDYEKKYKEALSRAATELETCGADKSLRNMIYAIFPDELVESEDEKIRKELIEHIKANKWADYVLFQKFSPDDVIAWLEKQGTPAKLSEEEQNRFAKGVLTSCALSFINYLDAHSYEGKMCVSNLECEDIENAFHNAIWDRLHRYYCKYIEKQGEQKPFDYENANIQQKDFAPKQEWSEEDENYLQSAENACEYQYGKNTSTILWLKHLKDRIGG